MRVRNARSIKKKKSYIKYIILSITILIVAACVYYRTTIVNTLINIEEYLVTLTGAHIKTVIVIGASPKVEKLIRAKLGVKEGNSIFSLSTTNMLNNLKKIGWIKTVSVHKILPNIIKIEVTERIPIAIYYHNKYYTLIDKDGNFIESVNKNPGLPLTSGAEANTKLFKILQILSKYPQLKKEVTSLIYMRKRRWDIVLNNKMLIKLPAGDTHRSMEDNIERALQVLTRLLQKPNIQNIAVSIDLRIPGNVVIHGIKKKEPKKK